MVDGVMVDGAASSGGRVAAGADSGSGTGSRRGRRNDPDRRDRLVDACLDVIARDGVAGTSHRKVAAQAGVPLGSTTYYFAGMGELLHAAFERFSHSVSDRFEARMEAADTPEEVREAVAAIILQDVFTSQRDLVLSHELYTLAARDPAYRDLTTAWMARSRAALERHVDPETARMLDVLIEGLTIHRALDAQARDPREVRIAVDRLVGERVSGERALSG